MVRHCSQRNRDPTCLIELLVYYEVPAEGQLDEIKQKFNSFVKNLMVLQ
jgi:hypothetical protein